jgi:hypothetical protein
MGVEGNFMLTSEIVYTFVFGLVMTIVALAAFVSSKNNSNSTRFAPVRVRVDERRRNAPPPQREETRELSQWDVYFWLFVGMVITMFVIAVQI